MSLITPGNTAVQKRVPSNAAERLTTGLLWIFLLGFGWVNLLDGGISLKGTSASVGYVRGSAGRAVAAGTFLLAGLVSALLARALALSRFSTGLLVLAALVPPLLFVLFSFGR